MNNQNRNNNRNGSKYEFNYINKPLSEEYADKSVLYLPKGKAEKYAIEFRGIPSHQLRKILNQVKEASALLESETKIDTARNILFSIVPLAAYNAGRDRKLQVLYKFIAGHINKQSIISSKDIIVFDELYTSIIAYHKAEGGK